MSGEGYFKDRNFEVLVIGLQNLFFSMNFLMDLWSCICLNMRRKFFCMIKFYQPRGFIWVLEDGNNVALKNRILNDNFRCFWGYNVWMMLFSVCNWMDLLNTIEGTTVCRLYWANIWPYYCRFVLLVRNF